MPPPISSADPVSPFDYRTVTFDNRVTRYYSDEHWSESDTDSDPDAGVSSGELGDMNPESTNDFIIPDQIVLGHFSEDEIMRIFGQQAFNLIYPGCVEL